MSDSMISLTRSGDLSFSRTSLQKMGYTRERGGKIYRDDLPFDLERSLFSFNIGAISESFNKMM
jgi:hypothetical protein